MVFDQKNAIFDKKKAPAAIGQPEENGFDQNVIFDQKKGACGNAPVGGKWFQSFFIQKKAPAATRQSEENGCSQKIIKNVKKREKHVRKTRKTCLSRYKIVKKSSKIGKKNHNILYKFDW